MTPADIDTGADGGSPGVDVGTVRGLTPRALLISRVSVNAATGVGPLGGGEALASVSAALLCADGEPVGPLPSPQPASASAHTAPA